ncbi:Hypothetical protein PEIBARAKI_6660 [Petrimonas sp. IBARAKI]|nr:Hypothetical protein PEIBARAKI_6660 [Petrimonas sp. IBARAKI]
MKKIVFIAFLLLLIGCKTKHPVIQVPVKTVERKVSTLVPIYIPGDSALLRTVFECDSLNNVLLKGISEQKGGNVGSTIRFKDGVMDYKADFKPDTVWLPSDTIYIEKDVPFLVKVPKVEYRQTKFQAIFFYIGLITAVALGVWLVIKLKFNFLKLK